MEAQCFGARQSPQVLCNAHLQKNVSLSPVQSALAKSLDLNPPEMNTYKKTGGPVGARDKPRGELLCVNRRRKLKGSPTGAALLGLSRPERGRYIFGGTARRRNQSQETRSSRDLLEERRAAISLPPSRLPSSFHPEKFLHTVFSIGIESATTFGRRSGDGSHKACPVAHFVSAGSSSSAARCRNPLSADAQREFAQRDEVALDWPLPRRACAGGWGSAERSQSLLFRGRRRGRLEKHQRRANFGAPVLERAPILHRGEPRFPLPSPT